MCLSSHLRAHHTAGKFYFYSMTLLHAMAGRAFTVCSVQFTIFAKACHFKMYHTRENVHPDIYIYEIHVIIHQVSNTK